MAEKYKVPEWVWVVTEKVGKKETMYALDDQERGVRFIPAFKSQEDGESGMPGLYKKAEAVYELEAMRLPMVAEHAVANHMDIFILDRDGVIMEQLTPVKDEEEKTGGEA
jgi:hypothetical protein